MRDLVKEQLAGKFSFLDQHLAKTDYILGGSFGVADAYAFTILGWAKFMGIDLARWTSLTAWLGRIAAREKVRETLIAEGLLQPETAAA
jgi:glutathione S-transferase